MVVQLTQLKMLKSKRKDQHKQSQNKMVKITWDLLRKLRKEILNIMIKKYHLLITSTERKSEVKIEMTMNL